MASAREVDNVKRFFIPNGLPPSSADPLKCDQFNNYFPSQLIYTTPLTVSTNGTLSSEVANRFSYDPDKSEIKMEIKTGIKFSDGSVLSPEDVAFSISRLLHSKPDFPVIRFIKGKDTWLKLAQPLKTFPDGITIKGQEVSIALERKVVNPLFRLTMTVFGIIPKSCVDLRTGQLSCSKPPSSGFYTHQTSNNDSALFTLRPEFTKRNFPTRLGFYYPKVSTPMETINVLTPEDVAFVYDLDINPEEFKQITSRFLTRRLASAWFSGMVLNPRISPFDDVNCRKFFINEFQKAYREFDSSPIKPAKSLFTNIVPGYLKDQELPVYLMDAGVEESCRRKLNGKILEWGNRKKAVPPGVANALSILNKKLNIKFLEPEIATGSHSGWPSYKSKNISFQLTNSGFWPLDPIGDVQMLFTPKLHEDYMDIWSNTTFVDLVKSLGSKTSEAEATKVMKSINKELYDMALMPIFGHLSYSFVSSSKDSSGESDNKSFALTLPYPWEVF